jgi:hypothetical protein
MIFFMLLLPFHTYDCARQNSLLNFVNFSSPTVTPRFLYLPLLLADANFFRRPCLALVGALCVATPPLASLFTLVDHHCSPFPQAALPILFFSFVFYQC